MFPTAPGSSAICGKNTPKKLACSALNFPKSLFCAAIILSTCIKQRQAVVNELCRVIGEFRDFNGGMISKQNELLCEVKNSLINEGTKYNEILLENFFYSLAPVIMRTILEPHAFKSLFQMLLESQERGIPNDHPYCLKIHSDDDFVFVLLMAHTRTLLDDLARAVDKLHLHSSDLAEGYLKGQDASCMGYIYRSGDPQKQHQFKEMVTCTIESSKSFAVPSLRN